MATLILTAVGTVAGGPIGGAIGAMLGQQVDRRLFAPKARQGPGLGELSVQTSSYGTPIPKIFGTMRAAGTVIWSTDLVESRSTSGGKGRPKVTNYSYSASFAVALSARPVASVGRIWADGKLLRGAAGDFKSATGFRLHPGDEDQAPDPMIAAAEGAAQTPAFRGLAYAVFEDFQLEDFGNRIPSLTFEVEADEGEVAIGAIAEELGGGRTVAAGMTPALTGYAAGGDSVRGALEALADVVPLSLFDDGGLLRLTAEVGDPLLLPEAARGGRLEIVRRGLGSMPGEVSIAYHDIVRDYQTGLQRAVRNGGRGADRRALPAVLAAGAAKALAEYRLASLWAGRVRAKVDLAWRAVALRPGSHVEIEGRTGLWKVERWTLGPMIATLELVGVPGSQPPDLVAASEGRAVSEADLPHGPTLIRLLDLPLGDGLETKPLLFVAAAGTSEGWRGAALSASYDAGASWQNMGGTAAPAAMGVTLDALPAAGSALFDADSALGRIAQRGDVARGAERRSLGWRRESGGSGRRARPVRRGDRAGRPALPHLATAARTARHRMGGGRPRLGRALHPDRARLPRRGGGACGRGGRRGANHGERSRGPRRRLGVGRDRRRGAAPAEPGPPRRARDRNGRSRDLMGAAEPAGLVLGQRRRHAARRGERALPARPCRRGIRAYRRAERPLLSLHRCRTGRGRGGSAFDIGFADRQPGRLAAGAAGY